MLVLIQTRVMPLPLSLMVAAWVTHTGVLLHYKVIQPYGSSYDPSDPNALEIGMWNTERMEKGSFATAACPAPRLTRCAETEVVLQKFTQMFPGKVGLFTHDNSNGARQTGKLLFAFSTA